MNEIEDDITSKITTRIISIACEVFNIEELEFGKSSSSQNTNVWDSLNQIKLVLSIEDEYSIKFQSHEIFEYASIELLVKKVVENSGERLNKP